MTSTFGPAPPGPLAPRRTPWPFLVGTALGAGTVLAGFVVGYLVWGDGPGGSTPPAELSGLFGEDLSDLDERLGDSFGEAGVKVVLLFDWTASTADQERIETEWRRSPLRAVLGFAPSYLPGTEDLPEGAVPAALVGLGEDTDAADIRDLACGFLDDPAVQGVRLFGPGDRQCNPSA